MSHSVRRLTETALMLAVATVLSLIKLVHLPFGGSITLFSMLPLILVSYRHGVRWGLFAGFVYGLIQLLFGLDNLSYATSFAAVVAILLLDYLIAFAALGLGGVFRRLFRSPTAALIAGTLLACTVRYCCHVVSGCTVWAGLSVPTAEAVLYSLAYNAFLLPETVLLLIGAAVLCRHLDLSKPDITRSAAAKKQTPATAAVAAIGTCAFAGALIYDIVTLLPLLQSEDEVFTTAALATADWATVAGVTTAGAVLFVFSLLLFHHKSRS